MKMRLEEEVKGRRNAIGNSRREGVTADIQDPVRNKTPRHGEGPEENLIPEKLRIKFAGWCKESTAPWRIFEDLMSALVDCRIRCDYCFRI